MIEFAPWVESVWQDVRYAVRGLRRQPAFTLAAIFTLGVGIGLNTSVATIFTSMFWRQWRVANPEQVVQVMIRDSRRASTEVRYPRYWALADSARLTEVVASSCGSGPRASDCRVTMGGENLVGEFVSGNYFRVLGLRMERGRGFRDDDDRPGAAAVAVISDRLWTTRFASDPGIVGKTIDLDGEPFTVVGVAARGFSGTSIVRRDVWIPLAAGGILRPTSRGMTWVEVAGRIRNGVTREQAQAELQSLHRGVDPDTRKPEGILLAGTSFMSRPNDRREGQIFFAILSLGVLLILLLACANAGNLLLARTLARGHEIRIRASVGASRVRIVRQLLTESLVLATAAAAVGLWMASLLPTFVIDRALRSSDMLPGGGIAFNLTPDRWALAFTIGVTLVTCLAFGLAPALHATRFGASRPSRLRAVLLAMQVAVSVVLLITAVLLVRGIEHGRTRDLGFAVDGVSVVSFDPPPPYDAARVAAFSNEFVTAIENMSGSDGFGITMAEPLGDRFRAGVRLAGGESSKETIVSTLRISPAYFSVLRLPIIAGRNLEPGDAIDDGILVNDVFAAQFWPGESPLGKTVIARTERYRETVRHVVGVVGRDDTEGMAIRLQRPRPRMYEPIGGVRTASAVWPGDDDRHVPSVMLPEAAAGAAPLIAAAAARIDPRVRVNVASLSANRDAMFNEAKFTAVLAGVLGVTALVLAALGVFGVFAYIVRQETRQIGIRMALGAQSRQIVGGVIAFGSRPLIAGLLAGVALALGASQLLRSSLVGFLYGLSPFDPVAYSAVLGILAVAGIVAVAIPAWRSTRVNPIVALRHDWPRATGSR